MASLTVMSYAEMLLAIVPAAPPTWKNQRTTSCPAPISANVPYLRRSRLMASAFCWVTRFLRSVFGSKLASTLLVVVGPIRAERGL